MAQLETINAAQTELVERYYKAYVTVHGQELADALIVTGKKNHRYYVVEPGAELPEEYKPTEFFELVGELEGIAASLPGAAGNEGDEGDNYYEQAQAEATEDAVVADGSESNPLEPGVGEHPDELVHGLDERDTDDSDLAAGGPAAGDGDWPDSPGLASADSEGEGADSEAGADEVRADAVVGEPDLSGQTDDTDADDSERGFSGDDSGPGDADIETAERGEVAEPSVGVESVLAEMLRHSDQGTRGSLAMGIDLADLDRTAREEGLNIREAVAQAREFFERRGRKLPGETTRSRMRTAANAWLGEATGYDLDTELTSELFVDDLGAPRTTEPDGDTLVPIPASGSDYNTLWTLRNLVVPGDDEHNGHVLALANMFSYRTIAKVAKHLNVANFEGQLRDWASLGSDTGEQAAITWAKSKEEVKTPEFKSIGGLPAGLIDTFKGEMTDEMTELAVEAAVFEPDEDEGRVKVNGTFNMEVLMEVWRLFPARSKMLIIRHLHGVITQDEHSELFGVDEELVVE